MKNLSLALVDRFSLDLSKLERIPIWAWLGLMAAFIRLVNLGQESIWYDESFTAWLAKLDLGHMLEAVRGDVHPPGWYLVEWVTVRLLGSSEIALRFPAALLGIALVLMVYRLAVLLGFEGRIAILSGSLACFLPGAIYYAQDARMYDLLAFGVLWMAISALKENWGYFAVAGVITVYSQNLGLIYVGALAGTIILWRLLYYLHTITTVSPSESVYRFQDLYGPLLATVAIFLCWLPWLPSFLGMAGAVKAGFWMLPLNGGTGLEPFFMIPMGWRLPDILQLHAYIVGLGMTTLSLIVCRKWLFTPRGLIILSVAIGMPFTTALVSLMWRSVYLPRAMFPSILALLVLWAYTIVRTTRANRAAILICLIPALIAGDVAHYFPVFPRFPVREWVQPIKANWREGDIAYAMANDGYIMLDYYLAGCPSAILPETTDLNQSLSAETKIAMGFNQLAFDDLKAKGYRRAWLTASENGLSSRVEIEGLARILATHHYSVIEHYDDSHNVLTTYLVDL